MGMDGAATTRLERRLIERAAEAHPLECCGLLLGRGGTVSEVRACRNVHPDPTRHFEIDPIALIAAHKAARAGGPDIVGYYHSHPAGCARPSVTDAAQAAGDRRIWAIVADDDVQWWRDGEGPEAAGRFVPCEQPGYRP